MKGENHEAQKKAFKESIKKTVHKLSTKHEKIKSQCKTKKRGNKNVMKVKHLIKFLKEFDQDYEVFFLAEEPEVKSYRITKIGLVDGIEALVLGSLECPECEG